MIALALAAALLAPQDTESWETLGERETMLVEIDAATIVADGSKRRARLRGTSRQAPGVMLTFMIVVDCETGRSQPEGGFDAYRDGQFLEHTQPYPDAEMAQGPEDDPVAAALTARVCPA